MQLRIAYRFLVLVALSVIGSSVVRMWGHQSCAEELWPLGLKVANILGTSIVFLVPASLICIWIKDAAALVVVAMFVVAGVGAAMIGGTPAALPSACGLSQAEKQAQVSAFTEGCLKRAVAVPPMSQWPQAYQVEACSCAAAKFVEAITVVDLKQIKSRGYLNAEEAQRLLINPTRACMSMIVAKYPKIPSK